MAKKKKRTVKASTKKKIKYGVQRTRAAGGKGRKKPKGGTRAAVYGGISTNMRNARRKVNRIIKKNQARMIARGGRPAITETGDTG